MTRWLGVAAMILITLTQSTNALGSADSYDLFVFSGEARPVRIQVHITVKTQSLAMSELEFLRDWFTYCAGNADANLNAEAAARAIRNNPLNRLLPGTSPSAVELGIEKGETYSGAELSDRWTKRPVGRFLRLDVAPAAQPHSELLTAALMRALDKNKDGKITVSEAAAAERILLTQFDIDEDECLTPLELVPDLLTAPLSSKKTPIRCVLLHPGMSDDDRIAEMCAIDEHVDRDQAKKWLNHGPDQQFNLSFCDQGQSRILTLVGGWQTDVVTQPADKLPLLNPPAVRMKFGKAADRDGDTQITESELNGYKKFYDRAAGIVATLSIQPQPRGWFEILDANGDGKLSVRELRGAWEKLADADAKKAGFILAPSPEKPSLTLTLVPGTTGVRNISLVKRVMPACGPAWFQAMDRNGDGDVSLREFIGTRDDFRRLDLNADGLISPEEAAVTTSNRK